MIISFSIKNFRSIKDKVTLSFEPDNSTTLENYYLIEPIPGLKLLKLGLIYGANGSGKTTILHGLDFLRNLVLMPSLKKNDTLAFNPFLFDQNTPGATSSFELQFVHNKTRYKYEVELTREAIISENLYFYSPKKALVYERKTDTQKQLSSIRFGTKIKIKKSLESALEANTLWNTTVLSGFLKTNIDADDLKNVTDWFIDVLKSVITPKTNLGSYITYRLEERKINKQNMLQLLKKADFNISDVSIEKKIRPINPNTRELIQLVNKQVNPDAAELDGLDSLESPELYFHHTVKTAGNISSYQLSYDDESEGTKRYFQYIGLLDQMLNSEIVIPIDELESSLHPDLLKHFLLLFLVNVKATQLLATTHYRELLIERDILRTDAIWFTEKKEDGSTDLYSLSDFDSSVVRDTTSIYNAYKSGKLGAVPDLSDYYLDTDNGKK